MTPSPYEFMHMQAEALFVHDTAGRLVRINEPEPTQPAPRFFLGRTAAGNLWRTRHDIPADLVMALERLVADEPVLGVNNAGGTDNTPPVHAAAYAALLEQHAPILGTHAGPAYTLPAEDTTPDAAYTGGAGASGITAIAITPENAHLLRAHFPWLVTTLADYAPVTAVVADGHAAAICFCSRITARAAEAGVYTEADYRGRGFAAETVRAWAAAVRAGGRIPLYSTAWSNTASRAVARKLGAAQYGDDFSIT